MFDIRWPAVYARSAQALNIPVDSFAPTGLLAGAANGHIVLVQYYAHLVHQSYLLLVVA